MQKSIGMYDVIVVGSGVGGSCVAAGLDADVLVLEKDKRIVPKDSGIVSRQFEAAFPHSGLVQHAISRMEIRSRNEHFFLKSRRPYAYLIDRVGFSSSLRRRIRKRAQLRYETVKEIRYGRHVTVLTNKGEHEARLVIGSDGANSVVRKSAGITLNTVFLGLMVKCRKISGDTISVHFNKEFSPDFFSWVIPQDAEYGIIAAKNAASSLERFRNTLQLPEGTLYAYPIPVGYTKSYADRCILIGDACGQTKPLTGGGIVFSLLAARHAVAVISSALKEKRFEAAFLARYERLWKAEFGSEIRRQLWLRRIYMKMSNSDIDTLFRTFGKHIESIDNFDYDKLTDSWARIPKTALARYAIAHARLLL